MSRSADSGTPSSVALLTFARDRGIFVLFVLIILLFAIWAGAIFASFDNAMLVVSAAAVTAIIAAGVAVGAMSGALDLSVPGTAALAGVLMGKVIAGGGPVWLGIAVALALGVVVGVANGLITLRGLNPLVVTIGTLSVLSGIAAVITEGEPIGGLDSLAFLGTDHVWKIPSSAFVVAGLYLIGWILLTRTRAGVRLLAVGGNAEAARRVGVSSDRYRILGFVITGVCSALGGIMVAATTTQASPAASTGVLFEALTAVALAGVSLAGGRGSLPKVLVGALIIATINNGLVIKNVQPFWALTITGVLLIAALMLEKILTAALADRIVSLGASPSAHVPAPTTAAEGRS
jgi:ribose transport system permease protein